MQTTFDWYEGDISLATRVQGLINAGYDIEIITPIKSLAGETVSTVIQAVIVAKKTSGDH